MLVAIGLGSSPRGSPPPATANDAATSVASTPLTAAAASPAPAIELTASDGSHFSLAARRGTPQLVFFGYTHCLDVCPLTIGIVGEAIAKASAPVQAVFVTIDPERDTTAWLADYARYTPPGFTFVTGSAAQISQTAAAWVCATPRSTRPHRATTR